MGDVSAAASEAISQEVVLTRGGGARAVSNVVVMDIYPKIVREMHQGAGRQRRPVPRTRFN